MNRPKPHILVIDDCPLTLAIMKDQLSAAGYEVSTADSGVYSNHLIYGAQPPSLILIDILMPLMAGDRKVQMLKKRSKSRDIPVVLMSSMDVLELQRRAEVVGADGILHKPIGERELLETVARFV